MAYVYPNRKPKPKLRRMQRGMVFGSILVAALSAFELFNFATTEYALATLIGGIQVLGVGWSSVLAIAFCAIDFAGLARLFTPERGRDEPKEVWYLLGAWFLGASMNAIMTWWAVTNALIGRPLGNEVVSREQLLTIVPIFVAGLVWLTRVLIIGTFGIAGERIFSIGSRITAGQTNARDRQLPNRSTTRRDTAAQRPPLRYQAPAQSQPPPRRSAASIADEELTYEDIDTPNPTPASNRPRMGYARPAPKPNVRTGYNYGYSTRAYSLVQPYVARPNTGKLGDQNGSADGPNGNTPFYR